MYKCSECGAEYKTKPEYCDCGNDCFEEIIVTKKELQNPLKQYNISIYAVLFFITCLILSILVILFFANYRPNPLEETTTRKQLTQNIPNIESIWDNTPVKPVVEELPKEEQIVEPTPQKIIQKPVVKQEPQKVIKKENKATKPVVKQEQKPVTKTVQTSHTTTQTKPKVTNNREVQNYKIRLRNALFYKLNCTAIQGSGKCGIQFAVNSDGKLINRAFTFQSDNKTLNDEVYKMLMRLPTFDTPPQSYNGELIKLTIEFNNGEYEILFAK